MSSLIGAEVFRSVRVLETVRNRIVLVRPYGAKAAQISSRRDRSVGARVVDRLGKQRIITDNHLLAHWAHGRDPHFAIDSRCAHDGRNDTGE